MNYLPLASGGSVASSLVLGTNDDKPGTTKTSFLAESSWSRGLHGIFGRFEWVQKDELVLALQPRDPTRLIFYPNGYETSHIPPPTVPGPVALPPVPIYAVSKLSGGVVREFPSFPWARTAVGVMGSLHFLPSSLRAAYGSLPMSGQVWVRAAF